MEEGFELVTHARVEQDRFRPALTGTQHIAVRETATGDQRLELFQTATSGQQIAHMNVNGGETCPIKGGGHLYMGVHALLTQHRDPWTCASGDHRGSNIFLRIKCQINVQARIAVVFLRFMFLIGTRRVVAQTLHLPGGFRPPGTQRVAAFTVDRAVTRTDHKAIARLRAAQQMRRVGKAVIRQDLLNHGAIGGVDLNHRAQLLGKQGGQRIDTQRGDVNDDAGDASQTLADALQAARSDAALATEQVHQAQLQRDQYRLYAPADGRVLQLAAAVGARSDGGATPLLTLLPDAPRLVRAELNESYAAAVRPGMQAEVISDDGRQTALGSAVVRWLAPAFGPAQLHDDADGASAGNDRSVACVLAFRQPSTLRLGQRVLVRFRNPSVAQR